MAVLIMLLRSISAEEMSPIAAWALICMLHPTTSMGHPEKRMRAIQDMTASGGADVDSSDNTLLLRVRVCGVQVPDVGCACYRVRDVREVREWMS